MVLSSGMMYHKSSGLSYFPTLKAAQLHSLHAVALGIAKLSDPIFKCEQIPGQLFTNHYGGPPDWVMLQEGRKASEATIIEVST